MDQRLDISMEEEITLYLKDVKPFIPRDTQQTILSYLHSLGIEGGVGKNAQGGFIKYYKPQENFEKFSNDFYWFITGGGK